MTFNPNIPQPGDNISNSQGQILTNFSQLNSIFSNDHYTWNDATAANRGYHKQITYPVAAASTSLTTGSKGITYTVNNSGLSNLTELFFANATHFTQITSNGNAIWKGSPVGGESGVVDWKAAFKGHMFLPNGIQLNWGFITSPTNSSSGGSVTYDQDFTTQTDIILITPATDNNGTNADIFVFKNSESTSGFKYLNTSSSSSTFAYMYYLAIGH